MCLASALHYKALTFPATSPENVKTTVSAFIYIKTNKGTGYVFPSSSNQYISTSNAGLIRGDYHFAHPNLSSGTIQANYVLTHGGIFVQQVVPL
ncbi:hypothetical protein BD769DRAFT_1600895 [Suillus cothurnatus]|nr:hypothetical protein BD769DRAFT_1600895 [Suillus cothurnatus]